MRGFHLRGFEVFSVLLGFGSLAFGVWGRGFRDWGALQAQGT